MRSLKQYLAILLSMCLAAHGLPVLAALAPASFKTVLSNEAMSTTVGGTYDVRIVHAEDGGGDVKVQALLVNMGGTVADGSLNSFGCDANYILEVLDGLGVPLQTVATGTVRAGSAKLAEGVALAANYPIRGYFRATMYCPYIPGLVAQTTVQR